MSEISVLLFVVNDSSAKMLFILRHRKAWARIDKLRDQEKLVMSFILCQDNLSHQQLGAGKHAALHIAGKTIKGQLGFWLY